MSTEQVKEIVVRPLGEGGAELGMTRAEILENINHLETMFQSELGLVVEVTFAWLIAMFFIAHRLSRAQFLVANGFLLVIAAIQFSSMYGLWTALEVWGRYGGFVSQIHAIGTEPTGLEKVLNFFVGGGVMVLGFWSVLAASIWWGVSCRRNH